MSPTHLALRQLRAFGIAGVLFFLLARQLFLQALALCAHRGLRTGRNQIVTFGFSGTFHLTPQSLLFSVSFSEPRAPRKLLLPSGTAPSELQGRRRRRRLRRRRTRNERRTTLSSSDVNAAPWNERNATLPYYLPCSSCAVAHEIPQPAVPFSGGGPGEIGRSVPLVTVCRVDIRAQHLFLRSHAYLCCLCRHAMLLLKAADAFTQQLQLCVKLFAPGYELGRLGQ